MSKSKYEFRYVAPQQRIYLGLIRAFLLAMVFFSQASFSTLEGLALANKLFSVSGFFGVLYFYVNLLQVKVEVRELFDPFMQRQGQELVWISFSLFISSIAIYLYHWLVTGP
jgi:hypothetical protein